MRIFVNSRNIEEIWPSIYHESHIVNEGWYKELLDRKGFNFWRLNHIEESLQGKNDTWNPKEVVSLYYEIKYPHDIHLGAIEVNMLAGVFFKELYRNDYEDHSAMVLVDGKGNLIFNRDNENVAEWVSQVEQELKAIPGKMAKVKDTFSFNSESNDYIITACYVADIESYACRVTSTGSLTQNLKQMSWTIALLMAGLFLVLITVTYVIIRMLLKRMNIIIHGMRKVQEGELNVEMPDSAKDEIGELAKHFKKMMVKINELISVVAQKESSKKEAELRALQSQINKHFIYNVLETIKMMAEINYQDEISNTVMALSSIMRYSLTWKKHYVALEDEVEIVRNYVRLLNIRYDYSVNLLVDIEDRCMSQRILKMSLQPVVENSFTHGIEPRGAGGSVTISSFLDEKTLII